MKGDRGETSLYDGTRVSKDDARVELNGEIDKLMALLGLCKVRSGSTDLFEKVQRDLMTVMAIVANGSPRRYTSSSHAVHHHHTRSHKRLSMGCPHCHAPS